MFELDLNCIYTISIIIKSTRNLSNNIEIYSGRHDPHDRGCDNYEVKETSSLYTWQDGR